VKQLLFYVVVGAALLNIATLAVSIARPDLRVWPPPDSRSWQYFYNGAVVYTALLGLVALGIVDWNGWVWHSWARLFAGGLGLASGFFALWGYRALGAHASLGLGGELVTTGPYRYSRNPQYVGTIPALLGYAIACNSELTFLAALIVSADFVLVPFAEESWCRENLGAAYQAYAAKVPRFLGVRGSRDRKTV